MTDEVLKLRLELISQRMEAAMTRLALIGRLAAAIIKAVQLRAEDSSE